MLRRTQRRRQRAGALIGQGVYGCGFFPGIRCSGEESHSNDSKVFSKLMELEDAEAEFEINALIRKIDPHEKYSIYPYKMCNIESKDYEKLKKEGIRSCELIPSTITNSHVINNINKGNLKILQSSYGGPTLFSIINRYNYMILNKIYISRTQKLIDFMYVLNAFENLFDGLVHYHNHDFAHLDIKDDNIVISSDAKTNKCKFIDFGLSNDVTKFDRDFVSIPIHSPADLLILIHWTKIFNSDNTINIPHDLIKTQANNITEGMVIPFEVCGASYDENLNVVHNMPLMDEIYINILSALYTYNNFNAKTVRDEVKWLLLTGIDVYGLGFTLARILYFMMDIKMYYGELYETDNKVIKESDVVLPLSIIHRLYTLVKNMTNLNPFQRYSAEEAQEVYSGIMTSLRSEQAQRRGRGMIKHVNKSKTRKSIKKLEKTLLSKNKEIALEPYLSSDVYYPKGVTKK